MPICSCAIRRKECGPLNLFFESIFTSGMVIVCRFQGWHAEVEHCSRSQPVFDRPWWEAAYTFAHNLLSSRTARPSHAAGRDDYRVLGWSPGRHLAARRKLASISPWIGGSERTLEARAGRCSQPDYQSARHTLDRSSYHPTICCSKIAGWGWERGRPRSALASDLPALRLRSAHLVCVSRLADWISIYE